MLKIGLLDHMGLGNLGDAATQDAVIGFLQAQKPDYQIVLFSLNPADSEKRHGLPAFPITWRNLPKQAPDELPGPVHSSHSGRQKPVAIHRRIRQFLRKNPFFKRVLRALRKVRQELRFMALSGKRLRGVDVLVISGGGQIDDSWGGAWSAPANLLRWAILARVSKTRLIFLGVGAGPLNARTSRFFCATALRLAQFVAFRDVESQKFVQDLGVRRDTSVIPDLAYSYPVDRIATSKYRHPERRVVGICPIPYKDPRWWPDKDAETYRQYVRALAEFASRLLLRGHEIRFLVGGIQMDRSVISDIRESIPNSGRFAASEKIVEQPIETVEQLIQEISKTDIVLASRFHGVLLAHLLLKPVIAVSYHQKIDSLMRENGQGESVISCDDVTSEGLLANFDLVNGNEAEICTHIEPRNIERRNALIGIYQELFG